jgi:hypothetical protein
MRSWIRPSTSKTGVALPWALFRVPLVCLACSHSFMCLSRMLSRIPFRHYNVSFLCRCSISVVALVPILSALCVAFSCVAFVSVGLV